MDNLDKLNEEIVNERSAEMLTLTTLFVIAFAFIATATYVMLEYINDFDY